MKEKTFDEKVENGILIACGIAVALMGGYLIGRFTAISDLQKGYLDCFIPK